MPDRVTWCKAVENSGAPTYGFVGFGSHHWEMGRPPLTALTCGLAQRTWRYCNCSLRYAKL